MAGFGFSEEQEMFRHTVRRFVQREVAPQGKELAARDEYPRELLRRLGEMGLLGMTFPEHYGGQPADWVTVGIAAEELAHADPVLGQMVGLNILMRMALDHGSAELQREWLPALSKGEKLGALGLTEPECGSDAAAIRTRAVRDGDYYILDGEKTSMTLGAYADAVQVYAKTDPAAGTRGVTCFWVPLNLPGISRYRFQDMGWRAISRASVIFDQVQVPASHRLGEEGRGFYMVMTEFDFQRVVLALSALGAAQASLREGMEYAKSRTAFGRPIARFEGISFQIAEHAALIEAVRMLCYRTLWLKDQGLPHVKESAMCKWLGPLVATQAIHDCLLIHGHIGYSAEYPLEGRLRDVIGFEIGDGTAEVMKIVIARELLGREYLPY